MKSIDLNSDLKIHTFKSIKSIENEYESLNSRERFKKRETYQLRENVTNNYKLLKYGNS